jgi:hypothetical protein
MARTGRAPSKEIGKRLAPGAPRRANAENRAEDPLVSLSTAKRQLQEWLVNMMPGDKSIRPAWRCDSCGQLVLDLQSGWVEWLAAEDTKGRPRVNGLRLVHRIGASPRWPEQHGCQYNPRDEFRKNRGIVEGLALERFAGPDGLMLLLSMIAERELPAQELIELAKRVQVPGYEAVHDLVRDAVREGVIAPSISSGFYLQSEIREVLQWAKYRTSANAS